MGQHFFYIFISMRLWLLILLNLYTLICIGKTTTSVTSGSWTVNTNWSNTRPSSSNDAIIIDIDDSINYESGSWTVGGIGSLIIKSGGILVINNITFNNGSSIRIESGGKLIVLGDLTNKNNSQDISIDGNLSVTGQLSNGNGGNIYGNGSIESGSYTGSCCIMSHNPSDLTGGSVINDSVVLPIELVYFHGELIDKTIVLNWETLSETNNDYFVIFKSYNANSFIEMTRINGAGNSNSILNYKYIDETPNIGENYYKLRQVDYDGKFKDFKIINVSFDNHGFKIYQGDNSIIIENIEDCFCCYLAIYDMSGRVLYTVKLNIKKGYNVFYINKLSPGTYIVKIYEPTTIKTEKIIVR